MKERTHYTQQRSGQVWIETVLYTLIGLILIGLVLSFVYPRIKAAQEKVVIEQSIEALNALDESITAVVDRGIENVKSYEFTLKRGELIVDGKSDEILIRIPELSSQYSEPGVEVSDGRVRVLTEVGQQYNTVTLKMAYKDRLNITYNADENQKTFSAAPTPYRLFLGNIGITKEGSGVRRVVVSIGETATEKRFADAGTQASAPPASGSPVVEFEKPNYGQQFNEPADIIIQVKEIGSDKISRVDFSYAGPDGQEKSLGSSLSSPYFYRWNPVKTIDNKDTEYKLFAKAFDKDGKPAPSPQFMPITVRKASANTPPSVSISSPAANAKFTTGEKISIKAEAADTDSSITKVEFFDGTTKLGEDTSAPYEYLWEGASVGSHSLMARATDDKGATKDSERVSISVEAPVQLAVALTSPANNAVFRAPAAITLETSTSGSVTKVEFFQGTTKLGEDTTAPFTFSWSSVPEGAYELTAKAWSGATAGPVSSSVHVDVIDSRLIAWWNFEEASWNPGVSGEVRDSANNGNNGVARGGASTTASDKKRGSRSAQFDGVDDYIEVPDTGKLLSDQDFTLMGWYKIQQFQTGGNEITGTFASRRDAYILSPEQSGGNWKTTFYLWNNNWIWTDFSGTSSDRPQAGVWEHWAMTYIPSSKEMFVYKNGQPVGINDNAGSSAWSGALYLGADCLSGACGSINNRFFNGLMDDVRIYNAALSQQEIQDIVAGKK